jgi:DNA-binding response OmpR family regulator
MQWTDLPLRARNVRFTSPARVLVIADEPLLPMIVLTLNHGVFRSWSTSSVKAGLDMIGQWKPHVVIVQIDLGNGDGDTIKVLGRPSPNGGVLPTIAITRRGDIKTKLQAFETGADDIVTVPFFPEELVARLFALLRRAYGEVVQFIPTIKIRELELDLFNQRIRAGSARPRLTAMEQALLYLLASNPGRILTRQQILDSVWGHDYNAESNVVDRHMRNLRVKLKDSWRKPRFIETIPGRGYRFVPGSEPLAAVKNGEAS